MDELILCLPATTNVAPSKSKDRTRDAQFAAKLQTNPPTGLFKQLWATNKHVAKSAWPCVAPCYHLAVRAERRKSRGGAADRANARKSILDLSGARAKACTSENVLLSS